MTTPLPKSLKSPRVVGIVVALLLLGMGGTYLFLNLQSQRRQQAEEEAAKPLPTQVKVAALGRVEPAGGVVNLSAAESGVVDQLFVEVGDFVSAGQVLAHLDAYEIRQAERDYAESQLIEARQTLNAQLNLSEAQVLEADTRIDQIDLPQAASMRSQTAIIQDLRSQLNLAEIDLARFETLTAQGALAQQQLDRQAAEVAQIKQKIAAAQAELMSLESARSANLDNASAQVSAAEANVQLSQATAGVQSAEQNLALAEARLAQTVLRAPSSGQIIEIFVEPGESTGGERGQQAVLSLGDTAAMQVVAEVYETDVGSVEIGQKATIRSRNGAFEQTLTGTVEDIALQIFKNDVLDDDPAANADARVVEVDIAIDQPEVIDSLTNLQVDVVIDVDEAS
ncbi:MAG: HlyD family efflux transporter periplasmic adaptor subunit [Phormidesmis sp. RL_2_1]|nr:HlyD family efflux transporter periplasmic adaptor subunit [Phormidesmis sp. RL_2_1]